MTDMFQNILNTKLEEIRRPPNLPIGTYLWSVFKAEEVNPVKEGSDWAKIEFTLKCVSPTEDVDTDELAEYGDVTGTFVRRTFLFNRTATESDARNARTLFQLKSFLLDHLGVEPEEGETIPEVLPRTVGLQCLGTIRHSQDRNDPEVFHNEISATAAV